MAVAKKGAFREGTGKSKIRITLTSRNVRAIESVAAAFLQNCRDLNHKVVGPVRLPTKNLAVSVRKSTSGNGTATFDTFTMRIHKRILDVTAEAPTVREITSIVVEPGVDVGLRALE